MRKWLEIDEVKDYKEEGSEGFEVSMVNWWLAGVLKVVPSGNYQALNRLFGSVCVSVLGEAWMFVKLTGWLRIYSQEQTHKLI